MKISTKGRYAIRVMLDLAKQGSGEYIPLLDIAKRQDISEKYLESIVAVLSKNDFLMSLRGKGGGYKLVKRPEEYTVGSILKLVEGSFAPVACLEKKPNRCERSAECETLKMWEGLEKLLEEYFGSITLADLMEQENGADYYII
ncbi:MAG: Rrf2 family transcriptional regulator [Lachnospiraceae bacterium]|jgi:Rrf2 family protein|nr:Rrf2 family transcriptional regulator [Lachnospiraceae bacterium]MCI8781022.1 Rrf2 family transcriptional regulator [Lachnospiraceae bacterium]